MADYNELVAYDIWRDFVVDNIELITSVIFGLFGRNNIIWRGICKVTKYMMKKMRSSQCISWMTGKVNRLKCQGHQILEVSKILMLIHPTQEQVTMY